MRMLDDDDHTLFLIFRRNYSNLKDEEALKLWDYSRILDLRKNAGKKKLSYFKISRMLGLKERQIYRILKWGKENYEQ